MTTKHYMLAMILVISAAVFLYCMFYGTPEITEWHDMEREARIYPDYARATIPPNIAPLNFIVREEGDFFRVKIYSRQSDPVIIDSCRPGIVIPIGRWRRLLDGNRGEDLFIDIFTQRDGRWNKFLPVKMNIAAENIDRFLVYRKMIPTHTQRCSKVGIYQRNLENYHESKIIDNRNLGTGGCVNCHSFCQNNPEKMVLGIRSYYYGIGTLMINDQSMRKIGIKMGYSSWHPSGKLVAYSVDTLPMFIHMSQKEARDTFTTESSLSFYIPSTGELFALPRLAGKDHLETWPRWSADGKHLYFCSTRKTWDAAVHPPGHYRDVKYDLMRIAYDVSANTWGKIETIVSAGESGLSSTMPQVSSDGRWLTFCTSGYGFFPTWQQDSDINIIDLENPSRSGSGGLKFRKIDANSHSSDSWHNWSSNSRWLVFSSKRDYGIFTKPYFSYVDENGKFHKAVLLPQKDPLFFDRCLKTYNTPEFTTGPVDRSGNSIFNIASEQR